MNEKIISKNNFVKRQIKMIPQTYRHNKLVTSKLNNFTVNSISIKSNCHLKDSSEMNSKDYFNILINKNNNNNIKSNKLKTAYKKNSHSNKKIYIKIQQKTDLSEYNIILDRTLDTFNKNSKIKKSLKKNNKVNNNTKIIKNIENIKKLRNKSENKNKIKNKSISDFINVSFGDSSIEINRPKKSENYLFNNFNGRKSSIPHPIRNILYDKLNNKEEHGINIIKNKIIKHKIKSKKLKNIQREFNENNNKLKLYNSIKYDKDLNINGFTNQNENINNEFFRFSKISKYNNNDLDYLNNKNKISNDFLDNRNSYSINQKIENHIIKYDDKNKSVDDKKEKDNNIIMSVPCMNCGKMVNMTKIDEHSNNCFEMKEEEDVTKKHNYISFIENKLKNIYEYANNFNNLNNLKLIIEQILSIKNINSSSIKELKEINNNLRYIMEKYYNSDNIFTLLSRVNILLEEKIKYFIKNNIIVNKNKVKKLDNSNFSFNKNNKVLRNTINGLQINKKSYLNHENSIDGVISESETMEYFDLKKMERILDKKKKIDNLDNFVNEAKNKRLFLMEVLKVKYQKVSENKLENLIPPILIWKEALKKNIKMKNWSKFIFEELNNPNKYLNLRGKIKDKKNEK